MPASKRRRAAMRVGSTPRPAAVEEPAVTVDSAPLTTPARPTRPSRAGAFQKLLGTRPQRPASTTAGADQPWGRLALLVLLSLVLVVEVVIGLVTHLLYHRDRQLLIDLFFFNAVLALPAALLLAPLVKRLMHQHRHLRFLESLSVGALYAVVVTLITLTFLHPTNLPANATADQLMNRLGGSDVPGIVLADLLAIVVTVQLYPGLNRLVTAPGRRARQRLVDRGGQPRPSRSAAAPSSSPRRRPAQPRTRGPRGGR